MSIKFDRILDIDGIYCDYALDYADEYDVIKELTEEELKEYNIDMLGMGEEEIEESSSLILAGNILNILLSDDCKTLHIDDNEIPYVIAYKTQNNGDVLFDVIFYGGCIENEQEDLVERLLSELTYIGGHHEKYREISR